MYLSLLDFSAIETDKFRIKTLKWITALVCSVVHPLRPLKWKTYRLAHLVSRIRINGRTEISLPANKISVLICKFVNCPLHLPTPSSEILTVSSEISALYLKNFVLWISTGTSRRELELLFFSQFLLLSWFFFINLLIKETILASNKKRCLS